MDLAELVSFVRARALAVVATCGPDGAAEAALVDVAATDAGEIVFDTSVRSRKYRNIQVSPQVALVVGWDDEVSVQCEGGADILMGEERERCLRTYVEQYPDRLERAQNPARALVRIRPVWIRHTDYRPATFGVHETHPGS